jgi:hypothetical protein
MVSSSNLSGGVAAAEQDDFLAVTPKMVRERDAPGEALHLTVRIDKADCAAATSTPSPAARSSGTGTQLVATA